eukprot:1402184-Amphidinium_carterae.1
MLANLTALEGEMMRGINPLVVNTAKSRPNVDVAVDLVVAAVALSWVLFPGQSLDILRWPVPYARER